MTHDTKLIHESLLTGYQDSYLLIRVYLWNSLKESYEKFSGTETFVIDHKSNWDLTSNFHSKVKLG